MSNALIIEVYSTQQKEVLAILALPLYPVMSNATRQDTSNVLYKQLCFGDIRKGWVSLPNLLVHVRIYLASTSGHQI